MGTFRLDVTVCRPGQRARVALVKGVLVDTGSELSWLPERLLSSIGVQVFKKNQPFVMANGSTIRRDVGIAVLGSGTFKTVDEVVMAKPGDQNLLGARTLEGFNASVDPRRKRLVAAGPIPAASSNVRVSSRHGCGASIRSG